MTDSWLKLAVRLGVTSVIALYCVWKLTGDVGSAAKDAAESGRAAQLAITAHLKADDAVRAITEQLVNVSLQSCVNASKNDDRKIKDCFRAMRSRPREPDDDSQ